MATTGFKASCSHAYAVCVFPKPKVIARLENKVVHLEKNNSRNFSRCPATFLLGCKNMNQMHSNSTSINAKDTFFHFMEN